MMNSGSAVSAEEQAYSITLVSFKSRKPFDEVIVDFEKQLGRLNEEQLSSSQDLPSAIKSMEGSSGLMIIRVLDMEHLLPALTASPTRARQYLVGNPLIASKMAAFNPLAALYAPPRVLIYTRDAATLISYDKPTSVFGRLTNKEIVPIAADLDQKFESLARQALEIGSPIHAS
ncbi:MAG: hypothetical protein C5B53_04845 [Candidatus Melainabacteria bacterium]|nr:MAG: hypothetical protein C5B53_04845 [Candidatus Melainabacteria bacterium]